METGNVVLRAARKADLHGLLALYQELNSQDQPLEPDLAETIYTQILAQPGLTIFIATNGTQALATASLVVVPNLTRSGRPYALIENVVTLKQHRGRGHARAVIHHAIEQAWREGCYKVMLLTGRADPAIHRFYEGCGFVQNKTGFQIRND